MLSGEPVSWPGLPSPGTDGGSLGPEEQLCRSRYSQAPSSYLGSSCLPGGLFSSGASLHAKTPLSAGGLLFNWVSNQAEWKINPEKKNLLVSPVSSAVADILQILCELSVQ